MCVCACVLCVENNAGQTALDIAVEKKYDECIELVSGALEEFGHWCAISIEHCVCCL